MLYHVLGTFFIFFFLVILVISFFLGGKSPKIFEPGYMLCTFYLKPSDRISLPFLAQIY